MEEEGLSAKRTKGEDCWKKLTRSKESMNKQKMNELLQAGEGGETEEFCVQLVSLRLVGP